MFLYILDINPLSDVCIFLCGLLIFLITVPFAGRDAFIFHKVPFPSHWPYLLIESLKEVLLMHKKLLPKKKKIMANRDKRPEVEWFLSL